MSRRWVTAALTLCPLAGCFSSQEAGKPFAAGARRELVVNATTPQDARKLLGPPLATATVGEGRERWTYEHTRVSARGLAPFSRTMFVSQTPHELLTLTFQSGVLTDCVYVVERYRTEGGAIVPAGTDREACGVAR